MQGRQHGARVTSRVAYGESPRGDTYDVSEGLAAGCARRGSARPRGAAVEGESNAQGKVKRAARARAPNGAARRTLSRAARGLKHAPLGRMHAPSGRTSQRLGVPTSGPTAPAAAEAFVRAAAASSAPPPPPPPPPPPRRTPSAARRPRSEAMASLALSVIPPREGARARSW